jgi:hypothetical protein
MTSTISETVNTALSANGLGSYMSHARPVVESLQNREAEIAESLIGFATSAGLPETEAVAAIREAGLYMPPPPVATLASADAQNQAASTDDGDLAAVLSRINNTLEDLAGFARQNGWRPTR